MIRQIAIQSFKVVFSGLLVFFLLRRIGLHTMTDAMASAHPGWLMLAFAIYSVSHLIGSFQWHKLMRSDGIAIPLKKTVSFYFVGLFFNNFLISSMGGDLFRMMDVRRHSRNGTGAVSTVFLDRFMGLLILSGMAVMTVPWVLEKEGVMASYRLPLLLLLSGWLFILFCLFSKRFARPIAWLIKRILPRRISVKGREVYRKIYDFKKNRSLMIQVVILSVLVQTARILTHYFVGKALGCQVPVIYFFLIIPIVAIMASLPVSLGGLGMREQTGVILFGTVGMLPQAAASMEFLAYLVGILSSLPGGLLFMIRAGNKKKGVDNENAV